MAAPSIRDTALRPYHDQLGHVPDAEIASLAGVSRSLVVKYRQEHSIPAYKPGAMPAPEPEPEPVAPFRGRRSAVKPYEHLLGKEPDGVIARLAGVTSENVRTYRLRRGIAAPASELAPSPAAAPAAAPAVTPAPVAPISAEVQAYRVALTDGSVFVVAAVDLEAASTRAVRHVGGGARADVRVRTLEYVGPFVA